MQITIVAVGTRMPNWVQEGFIEYQRRLPVNIRPKLIEVPLAKRRKTTVKENAVEKESEALFKNTQQDDCVIVLDVLGSKVSTNEVADFLKDCQLQSKNIHFLIGGPDGISPNYIRRAQFCWSLSEMTLPHSLVRIILLEQLYRAWSIRSNHPYHRA
ncbi:MAG: 23S rRNA (pseudouridine(1915)-N(3))-methyltransferase RlmH [Porticoccaceae bacterium]|nr:23S rRNA (pseudouridine(1915)-N(3))-methyltransferase RlmH [Porticoccaceae bacterium]|tara:strand:+ start:22075 stop:22545 length:471 start_codon:yes stop_codon:yes gene_type:complete